MRFSIIGAALLSCCPAFAASGASNFYYDYPLSGELTPVYYNIGGGNHPAGGYIELGILSSTKTYGIQYTHGIYGGSVDTEYTALELATGRVHVSYPDPVAPYDLFPEMVGDKRAEYVGRILGLKRAVDLAFFGSKSTLHEAGNRAHPALAELADYLDAVVKNDLGGGFAPNGIKYCINGKGWSAQYPCGEFLCEKTDSTLTDSCVVGVKH